MSKERILVVDDEPRIGRLIERIARSLGYEAHTISDSTSFDAVYQKLRPDLLVVDLQMSGVDGIELLRQLATQQIGIPVLVMSGMDESVLQAAERLGRSLGLNISGAVSKPVDVDTLKSWLARHTASRQDIRMPAITVTERELDDALERSALFVCYQPKLDLRAGQLVGVEALLWWNHPEHGYLAPSDFVPLAEQSDLITRITYWTAQAAIRQTAIWQRLLPGLTLSVNLSARAIDDLKFPDIIETMLSDLDFDPAKLILEVTESAAMRDPERTMEVLTRLRLKGVQLSIDDFGTGYSSLVQLYRLPYNELKIDKSFVMEARMKQEAAVIVQSTVDLGHRLAMRVVAEGIEDRDTYDWLTRIGCNEGQGYLISRAQNAVAFTDWMQQFSGLPSLSKPASKRSIPSYSSYSGHPDTPMRATAGELARFQ